jgi:type II secretory pathway pseudopilin PulG
LLVVISIIALLIGILLPALGAARRQARKMQNSTQVRGIHQQLVVFANGNAQFFPGRTTTGANKPAITASATQYGAAAPAANTQNAISLAIMLNNEAFAPDYLISPLENSALQQAPGMSTANNSASIEIAAPKSGSITIATPNSSYAFIEWYNAGLTSPSRRDEWFTTQNGLCPVVADRQKLIATNLVTTSVHVSTVTNTSANWEGHIAWNDNSTRYEGTGLIEGTALKVGTLQGDSTMDDIFVDAMAGPLTPAANVKFAYNQ